MRLTPLALLGAATAQTTVKFVADDDTATDGTFIPKIVPIDPTTGVGKNVFDAVDAALSKQTHAGKGIPKSATYHGEGSVNHLSWNVLIGNGFNDHQAIFFEGDPVDCYENHVDKTVITTTDTCTYEGALDFCELHGGELYFPDDLAMAYLNDMCVDDSTNAAFYTPWGGLLSQDAFWLGVQKNGEGDWETHSAHHFFEKFNTANKFRGLVGMTMVPVAGSVTESVTQTGKCEADTTCFFDLDAIVGDAESARQTQNPNAENRLGEFPYSAAGYAPTKASDSWNQNYLAEYFSENDPDQNCLTLDCNRNKGIQVVARRCDQNNVRPLCLMDIPMEYSALVCPATLEGVSHCGKNVGKVQYMHSYPTQCGGASCMGPTSHAHGSGNTHTTTGIDPILAAMAAQAEENGISAALELAFPAAAHDDDDDDADAILLPTRYFYLRDPYAADPSTVAGNCPCSCPAIPAWHTRTTNAVAATQTGATVTACCAPGYLFVGDAGWDYAVNADQTCGTLTCDDHVENANSVHFWDIDETLNTHMDWFDQAAVKKSHDGAENHVHATCVCPTATCPAITSTVANGAWRSGTTGTSSVGATAQFTCNSGYTLSVDGVIQSEFNAVCSGAAGGVCGAAWSTAILICREIPSCPYPMDREHGRHFSSSGVATHGNIGRLNVGNHVEYKCDLGFLPFFSGTDTAASFNDCHRECFELPSVHSGSHNWTAVAQLDPLWCDCRPAPCVDHELQSQHEYVNVGETGTGHYHTNVATSDISHNNWLQVSCKNGYNLITGANTIQTLTCGPDWTPAGNCVKVGCVDPTLPHADINTGHSCRSLDRVHQAAGDVWTAVSDGGFHWAGADEGSFNAYGATNGHLHLADATTDVFPGDKYEFTCRPGFQPYLKYSAALAAGNWGPLQGNSCTATCDGKGGWATTCECRCESICDE